MLKTAVMPAKYFTKTVCSCDAAGWDSFVCNVVPWHVDLRALLHGDGVELLDEYEPLLDQAHPVKLEDDFPIPVLPSWHLALALAVHEPTAVSTQRLQVDPCLASGSDKISLNQLKA